MPPQAGEHGFGAAGAGAQQPEGARLRPLHEGQAPHEAPQPHDVDLQVVRRQAARPPGARGAAVQDCGAGGAHEVGKVGVLPAGLGARRLFFQAPR